MFDVIAIFLTVAFGDLISSILHYDRIPIFGEIWNPDLILPTFILLQGLVISVVVNKGSSI